MPKLQREFKVWVVLLNGDKVEPWGNGGEFQYPFFPNGEEAKSWASRYLDTLEEKVDYKIKELKIMVSAQL